MQKEIAHPVLGNILYIKKIRCKRISISISVHKGIRVSLPLFATYALAQKFVDDSTEKILKALKRIAEKEKICGQNPNCTGKNYVPYTKEELTDIRKRAHNILPERLAYWAGTLNSGMIIKDKAGNTIKSPFNYNKVFIKNNKSKWGSCSSLRNINLNMHLVNLPDELRDFVIIHELCHLVYCNHGPGFHNLVNTACGGREKEYSRALRNYSHLLEAV